MAMTSVPRRTQAERSAAMRTRLLDATVECLADLGWARTSTTEVAQRAGVSRGAQVHHFPTKSDLVVAAVEHLFGRRLAEYREAFSKLSVDDRSADRAIALLEQSMRGTTFAAWLEVVVAARTDEALRRALEPVQHRFHDSVEAMFAEMYPGVDPIVAHFAFAVVEGITLERLTCPEHDRTDRLLEILKMFGQGLGRQ